MTEGYIITRSSAPFNHITQRKRVQQCWPGDAKLSTQCKISDWFLKGLLGDNEYTGLVMTEPNVRGTISVFKLADQEGLVSVFRAYYPALLRRMMREAIITPLRLEVGSKTGWPICKRIDNKVELFTRDYFPSFNAGDRSAATGGYTLINVRLQQEKLAKIREMPVISADDGTVRQVKIEGALRTIDIEDEDGAYHGFAARARNVYGPPVTNNWKQVVDNTLHDVFMKYEPYHHDMYARHDRKALLATHVRALDVKHFERCIGALVAVRAEYIGGDYEVVQNEILTTPYLCVGDDWKSKFLVRPDSAHGYGTQLASGDSSVATVAKECLTCLYAAFFASKYGFSVDDAIDYTLRGGDPSRVAFLNYGDDNLLYGEDLTAIDECQKFLAAYLDIEIEDPPGLIGWRYVPEHGWFLRRQSFALNFWKPERSPGPPFRKYFGLGLALRCNTFEKYGPPEMSALVQRQYEMLAMLGITREWIARKADEDAREAASKTLPLNYILGKEYLLTPEEREQIGLASRVPLELTRTAFNRLVRHEFRQ